MNEWNNSNMVGNAFDAVAASYDTDFSETYLGSYYRRRVQQVLGRYWQGGRRLLELNAGTGEDALFLVSHGNSVLATDISPGMLSCFRAKFESSGQQSVACATRVMAIEDLHILRPEVFDGALSNFGGLNCVADLEKFARDVAAVVRPSGLLVVCIMGPVVPWEWLWYGLRGDIRKAFRRLGGRANWRGIPIYYPAVGTVKKILREQAFHCLHQEAIGAFMPPSYVNAFAEKTPRLLALLKRLEEAFCQNPLSVRCADHYLLVMEKR